MSDAPDFSMPERKKKKSPLGAILVIFLSVILVINIISLYVDIKAPPSGDFSRVLGKGELKDLAMKLEKQSLNSAAVEVWKEYLSIAGLSPKEESALLYKIGNLYQTRGLYEKALENYYLSEKVYKNETLSKEIGLKVQESLESLGKFAALRQELDDRVGIKSGEKEEEALAVIDTEKITRADLDRLVDMQVEMVLAQYKNSVPPEVYAARKEELFKQYSDGSMLDSLLNSYLEQELLYRQAREAGTAEEEAVREKLKLVEKMTLGQEWLNREVSSRINITETDLSSYYEANKGSFINEGKQLSFEEARQDVYKQLLARKQYDLQKNLMDSLRTKYKVKINLEGAGDEKN